MGRKKKLPVRVLNPTSLQHVVRLEPGQSFNLVLDDDLYDCHLVEAAGEYLKVENLGRKEKRTEYHIVQTKDFKEWARYSSCLLGEVWVDSKSTLAKLVVMLEGSNVAKQNHVTLINPFYSDVRVRPYHILEIILYDMRYGFHDAWSCVWRPKIHGLGVEQIGHDSLGVYSQEWLEYVDCDPPDYCYAKLSRTEVPGGTQTWCRQHHFWFRFDESVMDLLAENHGVLHAGDFEITGRSHEHPIKYQAGIFLDVKKKYRRKVLSTLVLKEKQEHSVYTYRQTHRSAIVHVPSKIKSILPTVRDVAITPVQANDLDEGCKVLSAIPQEDKDLAEYDDDLIGLGRWARGKYGGVYHKVREPWH